MFNLAIVAFAVFTLVNILTVIGGRATYRNR